MDELTDRQREVLEYVRAFVRTHGYSPTFQQIGDEFGYTAPNAQFHCKALLRKGRFTKTPRGYLPA